MSNLYETLTLTKDPIALAQELSSDVQNTYFDLGCLLYHIKDGDLYKTYQGNKYYSNAHKKWKQFLEENFHISYRTAQYWMNIYRYFTDMGIDKDRISKLGWSKAKELIDITQDRNLLERGLVIAENGTLEDIQAWVASIDTEIERLGDDNRETLMHKKFQFKLYEAAGESAELIMQEAAKETNGNLNEAFFKILIEWYQARIPSTSNEELVLVYDIEDEHEELLAVG